MKCWIEELEFKEKISQLKLFEMDIKEYQGIIKKTAVFPAEIGLTYCTMGLCGEAGEVAEKIKKTIRDKEGKFTPEISLEIAKELGDVLWYITSLGNDLGFSLEEIANLNNEKTLSRKDRNVISGSGDNR